MGCAEVGSGSDAVSPSAAGDRGIPVSSTTTSIASLPRFRHLFCVAGSQLVSSRVLSGALTSSCLTGDPNFENLFRLAVKPPT